MLTAPSTAARARLFGLRARLLALLALVLLPWLALVFYTQADERNAAITSVNRDAMRLIRIATSNQAAEIDAARQLLAAFARLPQLRSADGGACSDFLADMLKSYPSYLNFGVAEVDGSLRCSAVALRGQVNIADRPYFRQALSTRRFSIGDYQIGRITGLPSINYAYPILRATDSVEAVVFAAQSLGWLTDALAHVEFPPGATLTVTDRNGMVLARLPDDDAGAGKPMPEADVFSRLATQPAGGVFEADDSRGVRRLWAHAPLIEGSQLQATIGVPKSVAFYDLERRFRRNLLALALVSALALAAAWFGSELFILRQVDALVDATGRLGAGDLGARATVVGRRGNELSLLARSFNAMAEMLQTRDRDLRIAEERTRAAEIEVAVSRAEMTIAREIQRSLLPEDPLILAGVQFAGRCMPAVAVGGDYFGYFPRGRSGVDSFVSDVSGHGVGAALLMAEARATFLAERLAASSAAPILAKLNEVLYEDLDRARLFMTACCATFDARTHELCYANAGHPPALLLRDADSGCQPLQAEGMLLGMTKDATFSETKVKLAAGDIVVFYTDGITERRSATGELFGVDRLKDALVAHRRDDARALVSAVLREVDRFAGSSPADDDVTIVAMKVAA